jgi:hypothetical protein
MVCLPYDHAERPEEVEERERDRLVGAVRELAEDGVDDGCDA